MAFFKISRSIVRRLTRASKSRMRCMAVCQIRLFAFTFQYHFYSLVLKLGDSLLKEDEELKQNRVLFQFTSEARRFLETVACALFKAYY